MKQIVCIALGCLFFFNSAISQTLESPKTIKEQNGNFTNYRAEGGLASTQTIGCIPLSEVKNTVTPADLYQGVGECLAKDNYELASRLFMLAGIYAAFDSERITDKTAAQAKTVMIMNLFSSISPDKKTKFSDAVKLTSTNPEMLSTICNEVQKIGIPNYYPNYMILHGIKSFNGNPNENALVKDFDANSTWNKLQSSYLNCKDTSEIAINSIQSTVPTNLISSVPAVPATPQTPAVITDSGQQALYEFKNSALWQAYIAALTDLKQVLSPDISIKTRLEHIDGFEFSSETKKKLFDLFGNENSLHLKTKKFDNGNTDLLFVLDSLDYQDPQTGSKAHTSALTGKTSYNKLYTKAHTDISMPLFSYDNNKSMKLTANDFSLATDQTLAYSSMWFGTNVVKLDHFAIDDSATAMHIKLDGISIKSDIKKHGKLVDIEFDYFIKSINWGNDGLGSAHIAFRINKIDGKKFAAISKNAEKLDQTNLTNEERVAAGTEVLKEFALDALNHGATLDIQDISVQYHGLTVGLNGHIAFNNIQRSDLESPKAIGEKVIARFNVHIPMPLVTEIARNFSRKSLEAQNKNGQPVTDKAVNAMAKVMIDKGMEKLLKEKWIHIKNDTILSTIEYKTGNLYINGKITSLPAPFQKLESTNVIPAPVPSHKLEAPR